MKISITREALREATVLAAGVVGLPRHIPVLGHALIEASGEGVRMTATNLDTTLRLKVKAEVLEPGSVLVPAKLLADIAAKIPNGVATISHADKESATLVAGRSRFVLATMPLEEFPHGVVPTLDGESWTLTGEQIAAASAVGFAASTEATRPILNGVHLFAKSGSLRAEATNGHRAVVLTIPTGDAGAFPVKGLIVHPNALKLAATLFPEGAALHTTDNLVALIHEGAEMYCRLIEGPYPDVEHIIPRDTMSSLRCNRAALLEMVERVGVAASDETRRVHFHLNGKLSLSAKYDNKQAADEMDGVEHSGPELTIGFNAGYVARMLSYFDSEEIEWAFTNPEHASVMRPAGEESPTGLLMPLRIID